MKTTGTRAIIHWFGSLIGVLFLIACCLGSLVLVYGGGSWRTAAQLEATSLATAEITELVGTNDYEQSSQSRPLSWLPAMTKALHIPFGNPLAMLEKQLPATDVSLDTMGQNQSSLFQSLTAWETSSKKIAMGWLPYDTASRSIQKIEQNPGITVVSPDWLTLLSKDGKLKNQIQPDVVTYAHQHKIQVWAMMTNNFQAALTHDTLHSPIVRKSLIQSIASTAESGKLDGINIDFENVRSSDQSDFTAFIHELHLALTPLHIALSVDITPDIAFLQDKDAFFHAGLAADCDYVVVMAYDEHWSSDQTPGPVADVPWVTNAVDDLLATGVSSDKLILGIPFYTQFWHVHSDGSVSSKAYATSQVDSILASHKAQSQWNDELGVAYAKYDQPDGYEEVWYETDKTMGLKLSLVNDRGLAGVAIWSLSLSDQQTWTTMMSALRKSLT